MMESNFEINILASGSSGNCLVVDNQIMIDCGVSRKFIENSGYDLKQLRVLCVSHRHSDHTNLAFIRYCLKNNIKCLIPQNVFAQLTSCRFNADDYQSLILLNDNLPFYHFALQNQQSYVLHVHPTDHFDLVNFAFEINRSDHKDLLYATDLRTVARTEQALGLADLGEYDTLILEGNYDEYYLHCYINNYLKTLDPTWNCESLNDEQLNTWIRANKYKNIPSDLSGILFRAVQNMRHLSKQQARLYARNHLKPNGVYYEVHRSSMFYAPVSDDF